MPSYGIEERYEFHPVKGHFWCIRDYDDTGKSASLYPGRIVWERKARKNDGEWYPADVRAEYERLTGKPEFSEQPGATPVNIVEMIAGEDSGFDQKCRFGYRVEGHAVYCHNDVWLYAPRKCRRTWYTGGKVKDEDCRGYQAHPAPKTAQGR